MSASYRKRNEIFPGPVHLLIYSVKGQDLCGRMRFKISANVRDYTARR
jgi:hypothetical protein